MTSTQVKENSEYLLITCSIHAHKLPMYSLEYYLWYDYASPNSPAHHHPAALSKSNRLPEGFAIFSITIPMYKNHFDI